MHDENIGIFTEKQKMKSENNDNLNTEPILVIASCRKYSEMSTNVLHSKPIMSIIIKFALIVRLCGQC